MAIAAAASTRPNMLSLLRHRDFALLWSGQAISQIGDGVFSIAMMWLILQLTGSALAMASLPILAMLPRLAFQLIGGVSVDRYDRRMLMLASDAIRGLIVLALALLIATGAVQMWHIYVFQVIFGIVAAFFYPAQGAIIPNLVSKEELVPANALTGLTRQVTLILGPALGGLLVATPEIGIAGACLVDALSFGVGAIGLALLRVPARAETAVKEKQSVWGDLKDGLRYLFSLRALVLILFVAMMLNFALSPFNVVIPVFLKNTLGQGPEMFGLVMAIFATGMVAGSVFAGMWTPSRRRIMIAIALVGAAGIALALVGGIAVLEATFLLTGMLGLLLAAADILISAALQEMVADEYRGRVYSVDVLISAGLTPVGLALGGGLGDAFGAATVIVGSGILTALCAFAALLFPDIRKLD